MKRRERIKSRKSPDPSSPYRSGEPASPHRSGEPYSPHRSGEGDTSAAAASDGGGGGDKGKHWMNRSPSSGEETVVRPKRRCKKVSLYDLMVMAKGGNLVPEEVPPSSRPNLQEAGEVSSAPPSGKKEDKRVVSRARQARRLIGAVVACAYLKAQENKVEKKPKPSSEDHCKIAQDEYEDGVGHSDSSLGLHASHSSSQSVEGREKGSFAEVETCSELKAEMKPKQSSEDHHKIAQDEDEDEDEGGHSASSLGLCASHNSSQSVEAREKGSFAEVESCLLNAEMKPKQSSEDHHKIAQDEDENGSVHSNKSLSSTLDLSEISQDEDEQHSEKVGLHAIVDHRQEQGRAEEDVQTLLDLDNDTIEESIEYYLSQLKYVGPKDPYSCAVEEPQHVLFERLALYRIRGYELLMDRNLDKLDDASLVQRYPPDILSEEGYFEHYEESLEWYFDPELNEYTDFEDYQRLVVRDDGNYYDWDSFSSARNSYEIDLAYVQYCGAIANETKWVEDYLSDKTVLWTKIKNVAYLQALKIAANFPNVSPSLLLTGFRVYIRRIEFDFLNYKGLDCLYFEIWKRVTKRKIDFTKALSEIYQENMFPSCTFHIEQDMKSPTRSWTMRHRYDAYVSCIGDSVSDGEALLKIKEAVIEMHPKPKVYVDYARKKLEIAKDIGLIKEVGPVFSTNV